MRLSADLAINCHFLYRLSAEQISGHLNQQF